MTHLFVSHSSQDNETIKRLFPQLEAAGISTWVDLKDLRTGDNWSRAIQNALNECWAALFVLSANSASSDECTNEMRKIMAAKKRIFVAMIEDVQTDDFPWWLHTNQYTKLFPDETAGITRLVTDIRPHVPTADAPPPPSRQFTGDLSPLLTRIPMSGRDTDLARVTGLLSQGVTSVLGVGGLGKSRLAAEVVLKDEWADGAVWHVCREFSTAEEALALLREHCALPVTAPRRDVLAAVHGRKLIVVLDNAESVEPGTRQADYVKLANDLHQAGTRVLITGRVEWAGIVMGRDHKPETLERDAAREVVVNMGKAFGIEADLTPHAERLALAAKQHPRLIEFAVGKLKRFPIEKVIRELEAFRSADVQAALDGMIRQTVRQMVEQHGGESETALKRLNVCRGGFTYDAAGVILGLLTDDGLDEDSLDKRLTVLQTWQFVTFREGRYSINPLVIAAVGEDEAAHQPHYDYYYALARMHRESQDYAGLDVESDNVTAAFEWALTTDAEDALWLANECGAFMNNRGRFKQCTDWMLRVATALAHNTGELYNSVQNSVGNSYLDLAEVEDRVGNLGRAIAAYAEALKHSKRDDAPISYALTHHNLGTAYLKLAEVEDRAGNLRLAIHSFAETLQHYKPDVTPLQYAITQNNLSIAYSGLAQIEDQAGNLRRAVTALTEALNYQTPSATPLDYSLTLSNLGATYLQLAGIEDGEKNVQRAIVTLTEALNYQTPRAAPLDYSLTQRNLGSALEASGDLKGALACWREAELHYRRLDMIERADLMLKWIADAEARLNAPPAPTTGESP